MNIIAPVTDYIPASVLTTLNDLVIRGAADPARYGQLSVVRVWRNGNQAIPTGAETVIAWNTEILDVNSEFDTGTYKFVPNRDKYVFISAFGKYSILNDQVVAKILIYRDAVLLADNHTAASGASTWGVQASILCKVLTTEEITISAYHEHGANRNFVGVTGMNCLSIFEIPVVP